LKSEKQKSDEHLKKIEELLQKSELEDDEKERLWTMIH
jgi:hypothetical protein